MKRKTSWEDFQVKIISLSTGWGIMWNIHVINDCFKDIVYLFIYLFIYLLLPRLPYISLLASPENLVLYPNNIP